jgi:hypothetical protein
MRESLASASPVVREAWKKKGAKPPALSVGPRLASVLRFGRTRRLPVSTDRENRFHDAMLEIYKRAKKEAKYNAKIFVGMVVERGGLDTARYLLNAATVSDGYTALWQRGRLDLTVERVVLEPEWQPLFSTTELQIAVDRLKQYQFTGAIPPIGPKTV